MTLMFHHHAMCLEVALISTKREIYLFMVVLTFMSYQFVYLNVCTLTSVEITHQHAPL